MEVKEDIYFMKHANPTTQKEKIIANHHKSCKARLSWITKESPSPASILAKYPRYMDVEETVCVLLD